MQNLPENKKTEFQQEMQRHRQQMKNITGIELPMPDANRNNPTGGNAKRNCQISSPEEMQKHRQAMESLPADKKELVKKEFINGLEKWANENSALINKFFHKTDAPLEQLKLYKFN
ncbi:MAG: hypothetical protein ACO26G_04270 [Rickettsiales bacterium]